MTKEKVKEVVVNSEKEMALKAALSKIEKDFGKGSIMKMDSTNVVDVPSIKTGSIKLDLACGVGGLPEGRIVEIFGPESSGKTTLTLEVIANAQKCGKTCAFIDVENAFDITYAKNLGIDVDKLLFSQPDSAEDALNISEALINSGAVDVVVVDSVAALTPKAEIEGDMGASHMGLQARLMSQALRKMVGITKKNNVLLIFINQIRMKIGVMYGCLHGSTMIPFTDGRNYPISQVVNERITGKVWSLNEETLEFEEKEIIDWHHNGHVDKPSDYLFINSIDTVSKKSFYTPLTEDHEVYSFESKKWIKSKNLKVGNILLTKRKSLINGELLDFVKGCLLGNSVLKLNNIYHCYDLKFKNTQLSNSYLDWKAKKLEVLKMSKNKQGNYISNVKDIFDLYYLNETNSNPLKVLSNRKISDITMMVWFAESGKLIIDKNGDKNYILSTYFKKERDLLKFKKILDINGYNSNIIKFKDNSYGWVLDTDKIEYVLKTHGNDDVVNFFNLTKNTIENKSNDDLEYEVKFKMVKSRVIKISSLSEEKFQDDSGKYDISIEDNHNYLAGGLNNGILVHNSPETTTGGRALNFYSSIRLDIRKIDKIKKGDEVIANEVKVKVVKNKVAPPFKEAVFEIVFGKGINQTAEIIDLSIGLGLIERAGAWYSYEGNKIGQGKEKTCVWLNENEDVKELLYNKIMESNQK